MSNALRGVIVSHAELGNALIEAVRVITGIDDALDAVSNDSCGKDALRQRINDIVGDAPCVVFVDLPGGSCLHAAAACGHSKANMAVVAGVNLPMLVDFVFRRDRSPHEAASEAVEAGSRAIRLVSS